MDSMKRHTWYLDETLIPLALFDPDVEAEEKEAIAKKLYSLPVPPTFQHSDKDLLEELDFSQSQPPSLLPLLGKNSWYMFQILDIAKDSDKHWLMCPSEFWSSVVQFNKMADFVNNLEVVNDCSERAIKLISDFVNDVHNEDDRQDLLLAIEQRRGQLGGASTKKQLQDAYSKIIHGSSK